MFDFLRRRGPQLGSPEFEVTRVHAPELFEPDPLPEVCEGNSEEDWALWEQALDSHAFDSLAAALTAVAKTQQGEPAPG